MKKEKKTFIEHLALWLNWPRFIFSLTLIFFLTGILFPFYWMVSSSFKSYAEIGGRGDALQVQDHGDERVVVDGVADQELQLATQGGAAPGGEVVAAAVGLAFQRFVQPGGLQGAQAGDQPMQHREGAGAVGDAAGAAAAAAAAAAATKQLSSGDPATVPPLSGRVDGVLSF